MNCTIKLVNCIDPHLNHRSITQRGFFFSEWMLMEKDIPGCLCVAHVFGHVLKYQKRTEHNPALHCKTKTLLVSFEVGWESWGGGARQLSVAENPSRQIVSVSRGMGREALLWF